MTRKKPQHFVPRWKPVMRWLRLIAAVDSALLGAAGTGQLSMPVWAMWWLAFMGVVLPIVLNALGSWADDEANVKIQTEK